MLKCVGEISEFGYDWVQHLAGGAHASDLVQTPDQERSGQDGTCGQGFGSVFRTFVIKIRCRWWNVHGKSRLDSRYATSREALVGRGWETAAELRGPKVTDENPVRHTRRRSTKQWCRGKVGVKHVGEIKVDRYSESVRLYPRQDGFESKWRHCRWVNWWRDESWYYSCRHQRRCVNCGKILDHVLQDQECPDYAPRPD